MSLQLEARTRCSAWLERIQIIYRRHERWVPAASFLLGVLYDGLTLGRADQWKTIVQLGFYLAAVQVLLTVEARNLVRPISFGDKLARWWAHRIDAIHFLLGSLLSAFTFFFVKSGSLVASSLFLAIIAGALVANEFSAMRRFGAPLRAGLFALCLASYACCLAPLWWGRLGAKPFASGMAAAALWLSFTLAIMALNTKKLRGLARNFALPFAAVIALFVLADKLRLIPPVPVALTHIGIYHDVQKVNDRYRTSSFKPPWRFWDEGDQRFTKRSDERVYCFFRVFSPGGFHEQLYVHWLRHDPQKSWQHIDVMPVAVTGGREQGYRAFTYKQNTTPGRWQIRIETSDGREVGRINFKIEADSGLGARTPQLEFF